MSDKIFVDTNIWIYAHLEKPEDARHERALRIIEDPAGLVTSVQVVNEYYSVMLRNGAPDDLIQENISTILRSIEICWFSEGLLRKAFEVRTRYRFSWWDSLIVASAQEIGCKTILTEDLQSGQAVGDLIVINPFLSNLSQ
jgi:predicted nucleic acid-binding protein